MFLYVINALADRGLNNYTETSIDPGSRPSDLSGMTINWLINEIGISSI